MLKTELLHSRKSVIQNYKDHKSKRKWMCEWRSNAYKYVPENTNKLKWQKRLCTGQCNSFAYPAPRRTNEFPAVKVLKRESEKKRNQLPVV